MPRRYAGSARIAGLLVALTLAAVGAAGCSSSKKSAGSTGSSASSSGQSNGSGSSVTFDGVTVDGATNLADKPQVSAKSASTPSALEVKDLVGGDGPAATPTSTVTVQYVGVRYADGKQFDASWDHGGATSFSLQQVVPGFTQGIGGNSQVTPMKVGGRRIMILPASLGYGASGTPDGSIPPNAPIVFVVDLVSVG
ncbi:MAG TPA: FKBP-type peptidyl-prolyl cis-trans isomerase [Jatrophihabitans sp.]|nr:FKBP-type peptidyl-prolyl cis-trans isomerase [Jatrophihabitans sp.]